MRKNEESTSTSTSPRFDLSPCMKETVAGRWSSTLGVKLDGPGWPAAREYSFPDRAAAGAHVGGAEEGARR